MYEKTPFDDATLAPFARQKNGRIPVLGGTLGSWHLSIERTPFERGTLTARYDRVAASWNRRLERLGFLTAYRKLMRRLLSGGHLAGLPEGAWVLDAGTGTGALSLALAAQHEAVKRETPLMFSAIDRSPRMLRAAQSAFDSARLNAKLRHGDVCRLPYDDGTFDLVMAAHVVEHLSAPEAAVREMVRVLQPGAPLLLVVTRRSLLGALVQLRWRVHCLGAQDLAMWLRDCGVADIQFAELPGPFWCRRMSLVCVGRKRA